MKFPKSNEYNSPEGTRENNTKEMAKKFYKSPKIQEVKLDSENICAGGIGGTSSSSPCEGDLG